MAPFRKSLSAFLVGLSLSQAAWPLGFGELELQSALNQPLQAEIPILGVPAYASDSIRVRLGKREDFASLGYDYLPEIDDIRTEIQQRDNRLVLLLRSRTALREPLLNLVLVAEEANTRYLRDYALLLDLPDSSRSRSAGNVSDVGTTATTVPTAVSNTAPAAPVASTPTPTATPVAAAPAATELASDTTQANNATQASLSPSQTRYGPTQPGDSLSKIAYRLGKASGVEWQAYGVAMYHANPDAFIAGDPNRIKAAVALQLPTASDVQRYRRADWNALFAGAGAGVSTPTAAAQPTAVAAPVSDATTTATPAVKTATATTPVTNSTIAVPATSAQDSAMLQRLQQQNSELKAELSAATARMQALETQLAQLDSRYAELTQTNVSVVAPTSELSAPNAAVTDMATATDALPATEASSATEAAPVTVQIRDTLAQTSAENAAAEAIAAEQSPIQTPSKPSTWQLVMWPLATVLALIIAGVLFWQWRERRSQRKALLPRVKTTRVPKPVLPSAEVDESAVPQVDVGSPDRRMLKIKQVQSALETYLAYQRFDRALELLEHEMHIAGDDLVLRRQLQRLQKDVRKAQTEWQESHKEQMSELFDRATTTHVEKPVARDDGKKTSG